MRVAVLSHTYVVDANRGKLASLARLPGMELMLVVPRRWTNPDLGQTVRAAPVSGAFEVVSLRASSCGFPSLLAYSPPGLWRVLRRFRPDILHVEEEPWSLAALEAALLCGHLGARFVFLTWENCNRRLPRPLEWIRRQVIARAAAAVAGNMEAKRLLERRSFRHPISVVPQLGVDPVRFAPAEPAGALAPPVVGFVGRLVPAKGLLVLLDAIAWLPAGVRVLVVGNGPLKPTVLARARALGLDGRFELRDDVRHHEVPDQLRRMSVLVLPSLTTGTWKEQFGHVLIEAMACAVPVVGSDSGAITEVIGDAGLVVREGDPDALGKALERLLASPARCAELGARGRSRVLAAYTNDAIAARLAAIWQAVVR